MAQLEKKVQAVPIDKFVVVTSDVVKSEPKYKPFWAPRHDRPLTEEFTNSIKEEGILHNPIVTTFEGKYIPIAGNRRIRGAKAAGLATVKVDVIPLDWDEINKIRTIENEQREGNSVFDKVHNMVAFVQPDDKLRPQGMSYEDTAKYFNNVSHQTIRNMVLLGKKGPKWLLQAIENKEITETAAVKMLAANIKNNGDNKTLLEAFKKYRETAKTSGTGNPRQTTRRNPAKPKPSSKLIQHWIAKATIAEPFKVLLKVVEGDISIADAKVLAKGKFDWMDEKIPAKAKPQPKKDEAAIEEGDLDTGEEGELPLVDTNDVVDYSDELNDDYLDTEGDEEETTEE